MIFEDCYSSEFGGGHFGRDQTMGKVLEHYYWVEMLDDVKEFCQTCDKCQRVKPINCLWSL